MDENIEHLLDNIPERQEPTPFQKRMLELLDMPQEHRDEDEQNEIENIMRAMPIPKLHIPTQEERAKEIAKRQHKQREQAKLWRETHKEEIKAYNKAYLEKNKERLSAYRKAYYYLHEKKKQKN